MAESSIARALRSGSADGEHAMAVMIRDSVDTTAGLSIFNHFVASLASNIDSGAAQAKGLVLVAASSSPESYNSILNNPKFGPHSSRCFQVVDCFSDPLGWERLLSPKNIDETREYLDVRDLDALMSAIQALGKVIVDNQARGRFALAFDSLSTFLRHHSLPAISKFISQLRTLDSMSALIWFVHGDLHEARVLNSLEYLATVVVYVEPQLECLSDSEDKHHVGRLRIRQKRRNGRVRVQVDEFRLGYLSLKFYPVERSSKMDNASSSLPHKVQFRLDLSEKEHEDRSKVVLPFEHQGNGSEVQIYDGRALIKSEGSDEKHESNSDNSIHYLRDSDDEHPDSDEDPDDDLDI